MRLIVCFCFYVESLFNILYKFFVFIKFYFLKICKFFNGDKLIIEEIDIYVLLIKV